MTSSFLALSPPGQVSPRAVLSERLSHVPFGLVMLAIRESLRPLLRFTVSQATKTGTCRWAIIYRLTHYIADKTNV